MCITFRLIDVVHGPKVSDTEVELSLVFEYIDQDMAMYLSRCPSPGLEKERIKVSPVLITLKQQDKNYYHDKYYQLMGMCCYPVQVLFTHSNGLHLLDCRVIWYLCVSPNFSYYIIHCECCVWNATYYHFLEWK